MAAMSPATAPGTNQMDTSPAVSASTTPKTTMAAIHKIVISLSPPPFKYSMHRATRAVTPIRLPAPAHLLAGDRLLTKSPRAVRSVRGAICAGAARAACPAAGTSS